MKSSFYQRDRKGTVNPVESLRRHRRRRCTHSLNSSMMTGEKRGRREGAKVGAGGVGGEREREREQMIETVVNVKR